MPVVAGAAVMVVLLLAGCSSSEHLVGVSSVTTAPAATPAPNRTAAAAGTLPSDVSAYGASATGLDGYPNINVDTARRLGGPPRSAAEQSRLEAELVALGARQRAGADGPAPSSVIGELQELGRRAREEAAAKSDGTTAQPRPVEP